MLISRVLKQVNQKLFNVQKKTTRGVQSARDVILSGGIIIISGVLIVWLSVFLYTAFYYAYMPSMTYIRPVHLQFKSCDEQKGICSFPSAHVQLTNKQQLLMVGQPYKVNLHLEMPESPANKELGMFMVCAQLRSRDGVLVEHSCRSAMLHYRSTLLHALTTLTFSPMMIFGTTEEKQNVILELFGNFEEDQSHPVTIIYIEIQSRHIEFYSATIMINAHLSGLRYLMYHWPILSAVVGIGTNLFFIALVCTLSYLHFTTYEDVGDDDFNYEESKKMEKTDEHKEILSTEEEEGQKATHDQSSESTSSDDTFTLPDFIESEKTSHSHIEFIK
ncbi:seipin [Osmia bicornis bicornis]|uniref:seipin n=1 Tax=Osmia bicornis bicornis TaxID=1437191 RepID=UPI0010F4BCC8|nr:seipin [Osmia bicornis bicornis]